MSVHTCPPHESILKGNLWWNTGCNSSVNSRSKKAEVYLPLSQIKFGVSWWNSTPITVELRLVHCCLCLSICRFACIHCIELPTWFTIVSSSVSSSYIFSPTSSNTFLSRPTAFKIPPSPHASHFSPASPSSHTPFLPLQHHVAQQCMRHIAHLFKISSSSVSYFYITLPTSPNTFSSYPIALNFPSATSASAAPRPCHRPGFQPPPSTRPTSFPTHTDKGIWKHSSHWFVLPWCFTAFWIIQLMLQQLGLVWFGCSCDSLHEDCWMYVHLSTQTMNMHIPFLKFTKKKNYTMCI